MSQAVRKRIASHHREDVSKVADQVGFLWRVEVTERVYDACVRWSDIDSRRQIHLSADLRLNALLHETLNAIRTGSAEASHQDFTHECVLRDGESQESSQLELRVVAHYSYQDGTQMLTVMRQDEVGEIPLNQNRSAV